MSREVMQQALDALEDASNAIESWGVYASEYFQNKHDLQADINNAGKAIAAIKAALAQPSCDWVQLFTDPENQPTQYGTMLMREWVGLTATDRKEIEKQSVYVEGAIRMTEAKLKEKNT